MDRVLERVILDEHAGLVFEIHHLVNVSELTEDVIEHFQRYEILVEPSSIQHLRLPHHLQEQGVHVLSRVHFLTVTVVIEILFVVFVRYLR